MFLRYLEPLTAPYRWFRNNVMRVKSVKGRVQVDVGRVKSYKQLAKAKAKEAKQMAASAKQKAHAVKGRVAGGPGQPGQLGPAPVGAAAGGAMPAGMQGPGMRPMAYQPPGGGPQVAGGPAPGYARAGAPGGAAGFAGAPGHQGSPSGGSAPVSGTNGIVVTGALWWKKHFCTQCGQQLDRTWDRCPYCSQGQPVAASFRTQAIMVDAAGTGNGLQLCGWLVALKGPQRGELFTLEPVTSVGTDPGCTVVLIDSYMSSHHCEIRAEGGTWMLRDLKSTNGTYVNDKRIEQHELVDSDFVRLGQSVLKFKSL
ncbi:MAG TPA: FHA domain-containing protein [Kofleriaceae bacterium]|nr:FHA domain-containing protein [Kofleriaceae bacterium]